MLKQIFILALYLGLPLNMAVAGESNVARESNVTGESIKVYAAASMTNVVNEITDHFSAHTAIKVIPVYGGSSALARQIDKGAPADIYISANKKWMNYLVDQGVINGDSVTIIAKNELVLISPASEKIAQFDLSDKEQWAQLLQNERLALGLPESVPVGIYAKQSLSHLGVWPVIKKRIAATHSARRALALVERGEARLGIVYKTDALFSNRVRIVAPLSTDSHEAIVYPMAALNNKPEVQALVDYFDSEQAQRIFKRYGFHTIGE